MDLVKIQLLYFVGCPNLDLARATALAALEGVAGATLEELDVRAATTPVELRGWGSPTILVNGQDVAGAEPTGACCRLYEPHHPDSRGVPPEEVISLAIRAALAEAHRGTLPIS